MMTHLTLMFESWRKGPNERRQGLGAVFVPEAFFKPVLGWRDEIFLRCMTLITDFGARIRSPFS
jgi:hypothetical protein